MEAPTRDYHHPYKPYGIQIELMNAIYGCIAEGKVGVFESPTGTGKSLSLICGSLTWLRDVQDDTSENQVKLEEESGEPTWVIEHAKLQRRESLIERKSELEARLRQIRAKEIGQKHRYENGEPRTKRLKAEGAGSMLRSDDETRFELEEYNSEAEDAKAEPSLTKMDGQGISSASMQLMKRLGLVLEPSSEDEGSSPPDELKIYFCSRTHSQLTQFVQELRRVDLPPPSWAVATDILPSGMASGQVVKHTPLGSRKNLCINPNVSKLGNAPAINERCLEMQQPEVSKDHKCPFIPNQENETLVNVFRDHTLAQIRDIEDLGTLGKRIGICPYYASRSTIKPAEVILPDRLKRSIMKLMKLRSLHCLIHCCCKDLRGKRSTCLSEGTW